MQKYEHAFGKNDIRGIYGEDITEEQFYNIGLGYINWLTKQNGKQSSDLKIGVCMDARLHSEPLKKALITGLLDSGVKHIEDYGIAPSPIGYYSEFAHKLDGAMVITASHNPSEYNGWYADCISIVRVAICASTQSPKLFDVLKILGKEEVARRIQAVKAAL